MNAQSSHDGERLFSVLKYPVPHAVRGSCKRSRSNERTFQNGWFRELKIARESNELAKGFRRNKRFTNFIGAHKESCLVFKHHGKDAIFFLLRNNVTSKHGYRGYNQNCIFNYKKLR